MELSYEEDEDVIDLCGDSPAPAEFRYTSFVAPKPKKAKAKGDGKPKAAAAKKRDAVGSGGGGKRAKGDRDLAGGTKSSRRAERKERDAKLRSGELSLPTPIIDFDSAKAAGMLRVVRLARTWRCTTPHKRTPHKRRHSFDRRQNR